MITDPQFTLTDARAMPGLSLQLSFADGFTARVQLAAIIARHPTLSDMADPDTFKQVELDEWGGCLRWSGRDDLELAADNLRAYAIKQAGQASHETLIEWMARYSLTLDEAAQALGLSRRMIAYYRSGKKPVPRTVALAIRGWEAEKALAV